MNKSIMIATPMYGGQCHGHYVRGLLTTMSNLRERGIETFWAHTMNESLITRGRNTLVHLFLEKGFDYLMFIDADIGFQADAVGMLIDADRDVSCGIYPKKEVNWDSIKKAIKEGKADDIHDYGGAFVMNMVEGTASTDEQGMIEVRHGGTGFMMIKKEVFSTLAPHVPSYRVSTVTDVNSGEFLHPEMKEFFATSIDASGALLSEDFHFCELWRKHGGKIYANPFIRLQHVGSYVFDGDIFKSGGNLK